MKTNTILVPFLSLIVATSFGCQKKSAESESQPAESATEQQQQQQQKPEEKAPEQGRIEIKGSDSEVNAVQRMAEKYMEKKPDVKIAVTGGGSGTGIAALLDKTIDIANASRPLASQEKVQAVKAGVNPVPSVFATDALSVIVNADNPIQKLTLDDLAKIFSGQAKDWSEFGGKGPIHAFGRQTSSGTYSFFKEAVVKGEYGSDVMQMNGNAQIVEAIGRDKGGIGYVAVGYIKEPNTGIKAVPVAADADHEAVMPTNEEAVAEGKYPIARPLFQYTNGEPTGVVKDFILFELSPEGKEVTKEMGFYPVRKGDDEQFNSHLKK